MATEEYKYNTNDIVEHQSDVLSSPLSVGPIQPFDESILEQVEGKPVPEAMRIIIRELNRVVEDINKYIPTYIPLPNPYPIQPYRPNTFPGITPYDPNRIGDPILPSQPRYGDYSPGIAVLC